MECIEKEVEDAAMAVAGVGGVTKKRRHADYVSDTDSLSSRASPVNPVEPLISPVDLSLGDLTLSQRAHRAAMPAAKLSRLNFRVKVQLPSGQVVALTLDRDDRLSTMLERVREHHGMACDAPVLLYRSTPVASWDLTFADLDVTPDGRVMFHIVTSVR